MTIENLNELLSPYGARRLTDADQSAYSWVSPTEDDDDE
jgi:hypothetical protein